MPVSVRIPTPLRSLTQGKEEVLAHGGNVGEVISHLDRQYPGIRERLLDDKGLRRFINVYLNDEDVRFLRALETPVKDGDTLTIVPAIAGGTS